MTDYFVGIDLHKTQFTTCIVRDDCLIDGGKQYPMSEEGYLAFSSDMHLLLSKNSGCSVNLAVESTGNARFFRDVMEENGFNVTIVNTLKFKVVNLSTKKTDKNDAKTLALFLSKNMLPESHICHPENESIRRILKSRALLVTDCVALKNQAHAVLLAYGITTKVAQFQSKKSRLSTISILDDPVKGIVEVLFETIDVLENQIKVLEKKLQSITNGNRTVELLMTIPGIGIVNACTICAYTDDISRFDSYKNYSAYCGLVPWVQTSNESVHYGHITKRGPSELRTALVQCVVAMVRMPAKTENTSLMKQYHILKEQKSSGKAIIAIARRLSRIIYIMLSTDTPFDISKLT